MQIMHTNQNIFDIPVDGKAVCVTTNGMVKRNGCAVMGKGIALEADRRYNLGADLGKKLRATGNHAYYLADRIVPATPGSTQHIHLISFPTKEDWRNNSIPELICQSAHELVAICKEHHLTDVYLPPVGCGCGGLDFHKDVEPILTPILDEAKTGIRFTVVLHS